MARAEFNVTAFNRFLAQKVQPFLEKKAREIAAEAALLAPKGATGELENSIHVTRTPTGAKVEVNAPHAGFVEKGTGPGHVPDQHHTYFPKLRRSGLIAWSDAKGANPYKVAKGIAVHGTPAQPYLEPSIQKVLGKLRFRWIKREI